MILPELTGNENLKNQLSRLEEQNRMPHAVIIDGGNEELRLKLAEHLAMWAVCESEGEKPCSSCKGCTLAKAKSHSDIHYAEGEGKTDSYNKKEMSFIVKDAYIKPYIADRKVYILSECDRKLPVISQNIFLKTLEEPPQDVLFIMTCKTSKSLLETIRSRAMTFTLESELGYSDEHLDLSREIALGIVAKSEMDLLKATYKLDERAKALTVLDLVIQLLRDGLAVYVGSEAELDAEIAETLCRKLTKKNYLELIDITKDAQLKITQNVGLKLVSTELCAKYRRALWQR
ncbi:MAG: hypothetical protein IJ903_02385 [Ruminococcus sp.]|nr:hypothetical protein [Ruminococcus sp.]